MIFVQAVSKNSSDPGSGLTEQIQIRRPDPRSVSLLERVISMASVVGKSYINFVLHSMTSQAADSRWVQRPQGQCGVGCFVSALHLRRMQG